MPLRVGVSPSSLPILYRAGPRLVFSSDGVVPSELSEIIPLSFGGVCSVARAAARSSMSFWICAILACTDWTSIPYGAPSSSCCPPSSVPDRGGDCSFCLDQDGSLRAFVVASFHGPLSSCPRNSSGAGRSRIGWIVVPSSGSVQRTSSSVRLITCGPGGMAPWTLVSLLLGISLWTAVGATDVSTSSGFPSVLNGT